MRSMNDRAKVNTERNSFIYIDTLLFLTLLYYCNLQRILSSSAFERFIRPDPALLRLFVKPIVWLCSLSSPLGSWINDLENEIVKKRKQRQEKLALFSNER